VARNLSTDAKTPTIISPSFAEDCDVNGLAEDSVRRSLMRKFVLFLRKMREKNTLHLYYFKFIYN